MGHYGIHKYFVIASFFTHVFEFWREDMIFFLLCNSFATFSCNLQNPELFHILHLHRSFKMGWLFYPFITS